MTFYLGEDEEPKTLGKAKVSTNISALFVFRICKSFNFLNTYV